MRGLLAAILVILATVALAEEPRLRANDNTVVRFP